MKNLLCILAVLVTLSLVAGCGGNDTTAIPPPTNTLKPTETPVPTATPKPTNTPVPPTETPEPTNTPTATPTPTPQLVLSPQDFSFPVAFDGPYALGHPLSYAPCHHWNGSYEVGSDNWYDIFHAGDMHMLNLSSIPQTIVVLSPVAGKVDKVTDFGENGLMVNIKTDYFSDGKRIYVDVSHIHRLFPGDENTPQIAVGTQVVQGQPIGISDTLFQWGRPEQAVDIAIRNGPEGANPLYNNFAPTSYIDPFPFLTDEITVLEEKGLIVFDLMRAHCLQSGHFP